MLLTTQAFRRILSFPRQATLFITSFMHHFIHFIHASLIFNYHFMLFITS